MAHRHLVWRDVCISARSKDMITCSASIGKMFSAPLLIAPLPGVVEVGVIGVPDEAWGETVAVFVVKAPDAAVDAAAMIAYCWVNLASYKKPRHVFVESLPRNTTNKVDKNALRERFVELGRAPQP